jgi:hypothetical protein
MAFIRFEDSANFTPDEITVQNTVYRRADLPKIVNPLAHFFPIDPLPQANGSDVLPFVPKWKAITFTPETVEFNGRTYRKAE